MAKKKARAGKYIYAVHYEAVHRLVARHNFDRERRIGAVETHSTAMDANSFDHCRERLGQLIADHKWTLVDVLKLERMATLE